MPTILTATDAAHALGYNMTARAWYIAYANVLFDRKIIHVKCNGERMSRYSVHAHINFGRWVATCPICQRENYVDPADPVFYCFGCGNQGSGMFVSVIFPDKDTREKIEALLLARPVEADPNAQNPIQMAVNSRPVIQGLFRNWDETQTVESLAVENQKIMELQHG